MKIHTYALALALLAVSAGVVSAGGGIDDPYPGNAATPQGYDTSVQGSLPVGAAGGITTPAPTAGNDYNRINDDAAENAADNNNDNDDEATSPARVWTVIAIVVIVAGGLGYWLWKRAQPTPTV